MKNEHNKQGNPFKKHIHNISESEKEQKLVATLAKTFKHEPISEQWGSTAGAALKFTWLGHAYSFSTGTFAIGVILYTQFIGLSTPLVALLLSFLFAGGIAYLIELSKRKANHNYFKDLFLGEASSMVLVLVFMLMAVSITASFYASYRMPLAVSPTPDYVDIEAIKMEYSTNIKDLEITAKNFEQRRMWKGHLASKDGQKLDQYNRDIQRLKDEKRQAIANAELENKQIWTNHEAEKTSQGYLLGWISIGMEILFVLCFWGYYKWLDLCRKERTPEGVEQVQEVKNYPPPPKENPHQRSVGFEYPNKDIKSEQTPVATGDNTSTTYWNGIVKTTVTHKDFNTQESKEMGLRDIRKSMEVYAGRVTQSVDALQKKGADQDTLMTLRNRLNKYQYWVNKSGELLDNYQKVIGDELR